VLAVAVLQALDEVPVLIEAALDLREAVLAHPDLPLRTVSVGLGDAPLDQVKPAEFVRGEHLDGWAVHWPAARAH
jgi:hypothetical protein